MEETSPGGASPKKSARHLDADTLKKQMRDKKTLIGVLEQQKIKFDEVKILILRLIQDFQNSGEMEFVEKEKLSTPFSDSAEAIQVLRRGINRFITKHENLASKFELEFSKNIFVLEQQLRQEENELKKAKERLQQAKDKRSHQLTIVNCNQRNKEVLCNTILMRRTALMHHQTTNERDLSLIHDRLDTATRDMQELEATLKSQQKEAQEIAAQSDERKKQEEAQNKAHMENVQTVEQLRKTFRDEAYAHNCALSALDIARQELVSLQMRIDSYFDNMKTRELLDAEHENKKLQAVIKNEYEILSKQKAVVDQKSTELQNTINEYTKKISVLNEQINQLEQKIQTQMMRIPDFPQLNQALERTIQQTKKHQAELLQKKIFLDEIEDRNHAMDQMEIQASKDRMAQLKILMPIGGDEMKKIEKLPELLSQRAKQQKEFEELLTNPGF